jgi:Fur family ferric uptake transcriptional regulator
MAERSLPRTAAPAPHLRAEKGERQTPEAILRQALKRRRLKYTAERQAVLREVLDTHAHFDARQLGRLLRKRGARVSQATVYRTLTVLREAGLLREVFRDAQGSHFEHVYGHEHHEHLICLRCGKVLEFQSARLEEIQDEACRARGFRPLRHQLQVFGYCEECDARTIDD